MHAAASIALSYRTIVFDQLGSTNQEGLDRARAGDRGRLWIRALMQTQGRGRVGRPWSSPVGNLYTSLILVDPSPMRFAPQLGFVAGVALASAVRRLPGVPDAVRLKWPNDLVYRGAKLAGILVEGCHRPDGAFACVIGFGVNCLSHPTGLDYPTTDLAEIGASAPSADELSRHLASEMGAALDLWDRGRNFGAVRERWLDLALPNGAPLTVRTSQSKTEGRFETIDEDGRLMLRTETGFLTVDAADVFPGFEAPAPAEASCDPEILNRVH